MSDETLPLSLKYNCPRLTYPVVNRIDFQVFTHESEGMVGRYAFF